jgi:SHS2 domain-containing protein
MTSNFKFIDHTADIALEVSGNTYEELFLAALEGWKRSVIDPAEEQKQEEIRSINFDEDSVEELLVTFLQEFNYLLETKKIFPVKADDLKILKNKNILQLISNVTFRSLTGSDTIRNEIKAVTFHQLDIRKEDDLYKTIIVFDI